MSVTSASALNQEWPRHCCAVGRIRSSQLSIRWQRARAWELVCPTRDQFGPWRCRRSHSAQLLRLEQRKGISPESSSKSTTPRLQTSATGPKLPRQTSGAMCVGVPATTVQRARRPSLAAKSSAMPRSMITACGCVAGSFTSVSWSSKMFSDFRSLCMMPWECTYAIACRHCRVTMATQRSGKCSCLERWSWRTWWSSPPAARSIIK
mmetsp:Transcript_106275/g.295704  ORF Transcript_106275/g.295704 Transcript_106275/m.295704 type:complete len:207 (-) Transcript_106275:374-994(-)